MLAVLSFEAADFRPSFGGVALWAGHQLFHGRLYLAGFGFGLLRVHGGLLLGPAGITDCSVKGLFGRQAIPPIVSEAMVLGFEQFFDIFAPAVTEFAHGIKLIVPSRHVVFLLGRSPSPASSKTRESNRPGEGALRSLRLSSGLGAVAFPPHAGLEEFAGEGLVFALERLVDPCRFGCRLLRGLCDQLNSGHLVVSLALLTDLVLTRMRSHSQFVLT
jgi:hypothetical protein